jgi:hypothetical protein
VALWAIAPYSGKKGIIMTHPKLIDAMSRPDFYPHRPSSVEVIQTHISFIFIAGDYVYKVKKVVDFGNGRQD